MTHHQVQQIITEGESSTIEFKQGFSKAVIETLVAFANSEGGRVLLGGRDDGSVVGVDLGTESLQHWTNEIKQKTEPSIIPTIIEVNFQDKRLVVLSISEYPIKPISYSGRYYQRKNNSNHQMSAAEVANAYWLTMQYSWDAFPYPKADFIDLDMEAIDAFIKKVDAIGRFKLAGDKEEALTKLRFVQDGVVTNAAMILFSKENLFYNVHIGRFKSPTLIVADTMVNGRLYDVIEKSMAVIISHLQFAFEITGKSTQRNEIPEYPLEAIRELLLNALVHRDYANPSDVIIKLFDQNIQFSNASGLYGNISIADLQTNHYQSSTRNKLLAEALYLTNDIEKYGSGFNRIREAISVYPTMQFAYKEASNAFVAELSYTQQKTSLKAVQDINDTLNKVQIQIIALIKEKLYITSEELATSLGVSLSTVKRHLSYLQNGQKIVRIGSRKTGRWQVNDIEEGEDDS